MLRLGHALPRGGPAATELALAALLVGRQTASLEQRDRREAPGCGAAADRSARSRSHASAATASWCSPNVVWSASAAAAVRRAGWPITVVASSAA